MECAINEKCYTVDGGRGICPLFSSPPRGICQLKSPHPREFAIQGKKNANSRGSARGGLGAGGIDLCITGLHENLGRDNRIEEPYKGPSIYVTNSMKLTSSPYFDLKATVKFVSFPSDSGWARTITNFTGRFMSGRNDLTPLIFLYLLRRGI